MVDIKVIWHYRDNTCHFIILPFSLMPQVKNEEMRVSRLSLPKG
jgi:hypothetical protein